MNPNILPVGEVPDPTRKCCADCRFMMSAVNWWCTNKEAIAYRGTKIPGVYNCHFWEPAEVEEPKTEKINPPANPITFWEMVKDFFR